MARYDRDDVLPVVVMIIIAVCVAIAAFLWLDYDAHHGREYSTNFMFFVRPAAF